MIHTRGNHTDDRDDVEPCDCEEKPKSIRELIRKRRQEIRATPDMLPDKAASLLMEMSALMGNCNDAILIADSNYAQKLVQLMSESKSVAEAKMKAEASPEWVSKYEARAMKEECLETVRSLKYYLKAKSDEYQVSGNQ